jgi:hypothetical protein
MLSLYPHTPTGLCFEVIVVIAQRKKCTLYVAR